VVFCFLEHSPADIYFCFSIGIGFKKEKEKKDTWYFPLSSELGEGEGDLRC
jgi:hypothetical protein